MRKRWSQAQGLKRGLRGGVCLGETWTLAPVCRAHAVTQGQLLGGRTAGPLEELLLGSSAGTEVSMRKASVDGSVTPGLLGRTESA